jgi:hypothetical protein
MDKYNKIKNNFEENNCKLLTSYEEYTNIKNKFIEDKLLKEVKTSTDNIRVKYIASCGHENDVAVVNFRVRKTGIICRDCKNKNVKERMTTLQLDNQGINQHIENDSINLLNKYINNKLILKRTLEGSTADILIKDTDTKEDVWIPIQIKATTKKSIFNYYTFRIIKETYKDMLIICICLEEEKIWIIPYNDIQTNTNITISNSSIYNKYIVTNDNIKDIILSYKDKYVCNTEAHFNTSLAYLLEREHQYIEKRKKYVNFLNYNNYILQNTPTDFIVNNKKVQEKVAGYRKDRDIQTVWLASNNGKKENGCRKFRTYRLGENDYYWFHSSINDTFWIVPESVLYQNDYITKSDETKNRSYIAINIKDGEYMTNEWLKDYEYNYLDINKDKIMKLFE